ncbi:MAG: hypothetical protein HOD72_01960 [Opitutae bacterium]|nr:hypothetical protein [Opitutae bacterium]
MAGYHQHLGRERMASRISGSILSIVVEAQSTQGIASLLAFLPATTDKPLRNCPFDACRRHLMGMMFV